METSIRNWIRCHREELITLAEEIWKHPEVAFTEKTALKLQKELLEKWGFTVEEAVYGLETSYKVEFGSGAPVFAIAAEYDALPELGHGCGHNLIAASSVAAFGALANYMKENSLSGKLILLGTPGEESYGGKVKMLENGCLDGVDASMMLHPSMRTIQDPGSTGIRRFTVEYKGHAAHASSSPEFGKNSLDAVMMLFNGINAWRQQMTDSARIHGVVLKGGTVPNIIPDYASCRFFLRSNDEAYLDYMEKRFRDMVKGSELMTETEAVITPFRTPYQSRKPNGPMNERFYSYAAELGMNPIKASPKAGRGSSDFGNFSRAVPGLHPYFEISKENICGHSPEFLEASDSPLGKENMLKGAEIMANIALDFLRDDSFRQEVRKDFEESGL